MTPKASRCKVAVGVVGELAGTDGRRSQYQHEDSIGTAPDGEKP
jgi:hypothetical protein